MSKLFGGGRNVMGSKSVAGHLDILGKSLTPAHHLDALRRAQKPAQEPAPTSSETSQDKSKQ